MASLNAPMTNNEIRNLDYFDRARLYHNVYKTVKYNDLPTLLKPFRTEDNGLKIVKGVIQGQNIKEPYTIVNLIKILCPEMPTTYQQVYNRAAFIADLCDTTVSKVIKSNLFNIKNFIPKLTDAAADEIIKNKGTGTIKDLTKDDYTPWIDPEPTPGPGGDGDYADEDKIYFMAEGNNVVTCDTPFADVIAKLPKLPAAELVFDGVGDYKNILDISSGYDSVNEVVHFNFIELYSDVITLFTIHYSANGITYETNEVVIGE